MNFSHLHDAPLAHDVFVSYLEREFGSVASLDAEAAERAGYNTVAEYKAAIAAQPKTNECPF